MIQMGANGQEQHLAEEEIREPLMDSDASCLQSSSDEHQGKEPEQGIENHKESTEQIEIEMQQGEVEVMKENESYGIEEKPTNDNIGLFA